MKSIKITSGKILESFLKHVASKSIDAAKKRLVEAGPFKDEEDDLETDKLPDMDKSSGGSSSSEKQPDPSSAAPAPVPPLPSASGAPVDNQQPKKDLSADEIKGYIKKQLEGEGNEVTVDRVINRLNSIRSGRSFKDEEISVQMEKYFSSLDDAEKVALETFLLGISFIVNPPNDASIAPDPSDRNIDIKSKENSSAGMQSKDQHPASFKPATAQKPAQHHVKQQRRPPTPTTNTSIENIGAPIRVKKNVP